VGRRPGSPGPDPSPIRSYLVLVQLLIVAGVALFPLPALYLGARNLLQRPGYSVDERSDRASFLMLVSLRALTCLLVFALSLVTLVSAVGALVKGVELHGLVYVFFVLDLLLALLIVLTFSRRERRPVRRPATPARR
jgi:hypothetical protein